MPSPNPDQQANAAVITLKRLASRRYRDGMPRYGLPNDRAFGVPVGAIQKLGKQLGHDHALALALWKTGWYEAQMLTAFVGEPDRLTPAQMDRLVRDSDNWGICDTVCFHLFDRTPHAMKKVTAWARLPGEFERRTAFALLASLALHDGESGDAPYLRTLPLIERAATDERNFVKKAVSWALRGVGTRSPALHAASVALAKQLAASEDATSRWIGKDALRDLSRPLVVARAKKRAKAKEPG